MPKKSEDVRKILAAEVEAQAEAVTFREESIVATIGQDLKRQLMAFSEATGEKYQAIVRQARSDFFKSKDIDRYVKEALIKRLEASGISLEDLQRFKAEQK